MANLSSTIRLRPKSTLPFTLDDATVSKIAGVTLDNRKKSGRPFLASHSFQARYNLQPGCFGVAGSACFNLHPKTTDFLPLAVKTNVGSDLIHNPLDIRTD